jgi:peptidoglycan/LPS O-acetylase OafA/YrhL
MLPYRNYLATLTPLRGVAALIVVIFHSNLMLMPFMPQGSVNVITAGWLWVDFFFVLSGFIISYVYADIFKDVFTGASYWKYLKARFARVYPLHFITMIWCAIGAAITIHYATSMHPFFADMINPAAVIPSAFFLHSLGLYISAPLNTPSWSLSTEWWIYMIFPVLVPIFYRLNSLGKILAAVAIGGLFVFIKYYLSSLHPFYPGAPPTLNLIVDFGIFRCLAGFLLGMLAFKVYVDKTAMQLFRQTWVFITLFAGLLLAMQFGTEDLLVVCFFPFVILAAAHNRTGVEHLLKAPVLQRLGDWSFSIYMVHVPIMYIFWIYQTIQHPTMFEQFPPEQIEPPNYVLGGLFCAIVVGLTLGVAYLTYRYIEVPARMILNRRFNRKEMETVNVAKL